MDRVPDFAVALCIQIECVIASPQLDDTDVIGKIPKRYEVACVIDGVVPGTGVNEAVDFVDALEI